MTETAVPGAAMLVRDFVNTREPQTGSEELTSPEALRAWFAGRGLVGDDATFDDRDLDAAVVDALDLLRDRLDALRIGAVCEVAHERLPRQLEEDALEGGRRHGR